MKIARKFVWSIVLALASAGLTHTTLAQSTTIVAADASATAQPALTVATVEPPIENWPVWFWKRILEIYDTNGNGVLDNDEYQHFWEDMQREELGDPNYVWIDKDEFIDWAMRVLGLTREEAELLWQEMLGTEGPDANGDGRISPQEWRDWMRRTRPRKTYPTASATLDVSPASLDIESATLTGEEP
jgi:hypothetical protein